MTASKLSLYQNALLLLGERKLSSLTENRESRRVLDLVWDSGVTDLALSKSLWNFALRTIQIEYTADVEPSFGFTRAFSKPSDWIRTAGVSDYSYFEQSLTKYADEAGYWFADFDTIYVKYISNDSSYGGDLSLWPVNFSRYVESLMAFEACERITQSDAKLERIAKIMDDRLGDAKNTDAMNDPTRFPPNGSWVSSRTGRGQSTRVGSGRIF